MVWKIRCPDKVLSITVDPSILEPVVWERPMLPPREFSFPDKFLVDPRVITLKDLRTIRIDPTLGRIYLPQDMHDLDLVSSPDIQAKPEKDESGVGRCFEYPHDLFDGPVLTLDGKPFLVHARGRSKEL